MFDTELVVFGVLQFIWIYSKPQTFLCGYFTDNFIILPYQSYCYIKIRFTKPKFIFFYFYREPFSLRMINFRHINDLIKIKTLTILLNTLKLSEAF